MSTSETEEPANTAPIAVPPPTENEPEPAEPSSTPEEPPPPVEPAAEVAEPVVARAMPVQAALGRDVVYVPLAVSVGDGFKFGCGFFLALVLAMLVGFVLLAALFALTSIFGVNLPLGR